jgi:integrase
MASVCPEPNGRKLIQINQLPNRPKVRLGKVSDKAAQSIRVKIEAVLASKASGQPLDHETASWLGRIDRKLHGRLVSLGLVNARDEAQTAALSDVVARYIRGRSKIKPNTLRNYETTKRLLEEHFGKDRLVGSIHAGSARDYREWLVNKYASATVAREIKRARQFFEYAKDHRLTAENPFAKIKAGSQKNTKKKHFVDDGVIEKVLGACPDSNWRLLLVLARYGGLRIPSELQQLTWADVDWHGGRFTLRVPKKEHIDGHETRIVPLFPEIRPYLERAFDEAPSGTVHVLPKRFHKAGYAFAGIKRAIEKAGLKIWPKLFVNLRASRETELMRREPAHLVYAWIGNSREVAEDHYLMVTDADYARVSAEPSAKPASKDPIAEAVQKAVQSAATVNRQQPSLEKEPAVSPAFARDTAVQVPPRGVEPRFSD